MLVFILLGFGGTVLIPSWKLYPLVVVTGLSMLIILITLTGMTVVIDYRTPFDSIFIIFGIIGTIRIANWLAEKKPVEKHR